MTGIISQWIKGCIKVQTTQTMILLEKLVVAQGVK
jgi:hypothetical protein